jgi:hypothetical protein
MNFKTSCAKGQLPERELSAGWSFARYAKIRPFGWFFAPAPKIFKRTFLGAGLFFAWNFSSAKRTRANSQTLERHLSWYQGVHGCVVYFVKAKVDLGEKLARILD